MQSGSQFWYKQNISQVRPAVCLIVCSGLEAFRDFYDVVRSRLYGDLILLGLFEKRHMSVGSKTYFVMRA